MRFIIIFVMHINFTLSKKILAWYDNNKRKLPWRVSKKSPNKLYYRLLSEFMLQQTQVKTVIPYFNKFTKKFKTLKDLSKSNEKEILTSTAIQSGMGLIAFYILVAGAIGAVLYAELSKAFAK